VGTNQHAGKNARAWNKAANAHIRRIKILSKPALGKDNKRMIISQIKVTPAKGRLSENHATLMRILHSIDADNVDVVITPECFLDGYVCTERHVTRDNIHTHAIDPSTSPFTSEISTWARQTASWVIFGCLRKDSTGVYNSALAYDRNGNLACHYDKTHCQTHDLKYTAGAALPVFDSDLGTFGMMICADRRWPETVRTLAVQGAYIIFNPTYGMHDERNLRMMQTRSYESEVFIAFTHPRQALITNAVGEIVVNNCDPDQEIVSTRVDLSDVDTIRSGRSAHLRDRRPELYQP
jgi:predicted amidohydrolase